MKIGLPDVLDANELGSVATGRNPAIFTTIINMILILRGRRRKTRNKTDIRNTIKPG